MNDKTIQGQIRKAIKLIQTREEVDILVEVMSAIILGDMKYVSNYLSIIKTRVQKGMPKPADGEIIKILTLLLGQTMAKVIK